MVYVGHDGGLDQEAWTSGSGKGEDLGYIWKEVKLTGCGT